MLALSKCLVGSLFLTLGPLPPEPTPNPTGKGYMGIWFSGAGDAGSLGIDRVEPGNPAERAGIRAGDVIVRVGKLTPQNHQQVIDYVTMHRPGAAIEIEVKRGTEKKTFNLKLGERTPDSTLNRTPIFPIIEP